MKTLSALIFCISVILLVYLSGATNKAERFLITQRPIAIFAEVECLETCAEKKLIATIPANQKVKILARLKGQTKTVTRVEYQDQTGWFTVTENAVVFKEEKHAK